MNSNDKYNTQQKLEEIYKAIKIVNGRMSFINSKLNTLDSKINAVYQYITNGYNIKTVMSNVPNIVPNLTGAQIVNMIQLGWTIDQISYVSGYSYNKINDLYKKSRGIK